MSTTPSLAPTSPSTANNTSPPSPPATSSAPPPATPSLLPPTTPTTTPPSPSTPLTSMPPPLSSKVNNLPTCKCSSDILCRAVAEMLMKRALYLEAMKILKVILWMLATREKVLQKWLKHRFLKPIRLVLSVDGGVGEGGGGVEVEGVKGEGGVEVGIVTSRSLTEAGSDRQCAEHGQGAAPGRLPVGEVHE